MPDTTKKYLDGAKKLETRVETVFPNQTEHVLWSGAAWTDSCIAWKLCWDCLGPFHDIYLASVEDIFGVYPPLSVVPEQGRGYIPERGAS